MVLNLLLGYPTGDCKMYATEKQNRGSDCSLIVVSLTTENNRIIQAVAFSDFTFLLQTFCNLLYVQCVYKRGSVARGHLGGSPDVA